MKLVFASHKLEQQCRNHKEAKKLFGGNDQLAVSLLARIIALESSLSLKDIIVQPQFHFHNLENKHKRNLKGFFAIDVKTRREPWRIVLQPLDLDQKPYANVLINEIAGTVRIVRIEEVSNHYE